jgi:putative ABC transport system permease protein
VIWIDDLLRDVRFASRSFLRNPGFAFIAAASLALATGATTAIFSIVNGVLLRPLPLGNPDQLVQVYGSWREDRRGSADEIDDPLGSIEIETYSTQSRLVAAFAGYSVTTRHLQRANGTERLTAVAADLTFFTLLNVETIAGRTFREGDGQDVAVISAGLWEQRFARDPAVVGSTVTLNGRPCTVLGVMPDSFQFPYTAASLLPGALPESRTDIWIPISPLRDSNSPTGLRQGRVNVVARLQPGISRPAAEAELRVLAQRLEEQHRAVNLGVGVRLVPLTEVVVGPVRRSLWMLFAAVGLVLAAACANVANLLLSRMAARTREVVTRAALGADRIRLTRQFLTESLLLSLVGGAAGMAIARWGTDVLVALVSTRIPRAHEITLDWYAFVFLLLICLATAVLFGLAPALTAIRHDIHTVTKDSTGHATGGGAYARIRDGLVVIEVALAFVLALGAVQVMREAIRLENVATGMVTANVLTLHVTPRTTAQDYYEIEERVAQLPGVRAAGFTQLVPLQNWGWTGGFSIRGEATDRSRLMIAGLRYVTPGYFATLGIPVLHGRGFTRGDTAEAPRVILVNEALVRTYFPAATNAVGRDLDRGTIIGVVGDVRQVRLDRPAEPEIYYPAAQNVTMTSDLGMSLIVRGARSPESLTPAIRDAVTKVNANLAIFNVKTMEQVLADSLWEVHLYRWLIGLFTALTLVLATIGLHGVIAYNVTSRMREFAVRLALGADPAGLARQVVRRAIGLTAAGLAGGALIAAALSPWLEQLPVARQSDPSAYGAIGAALIAVGLAAAAVPALRAAAVNPSAALRQE